MIPTGRADPTRNNPWARSLLVFAQRYTDGLARGRSGTRFRRSGRDRRQSAWTSRVARYARGLDYHDVLLKDIKSVARGIEGRFPDWRRSPSTDTGPYLEREYAWLAGLGFLGKNTCLIHEKLGSGLFLGVALTNLDIDGLVSGQPAGEPLYAVTPRRRPPATKGGRQPLRHLHPLYRGLSDRGPDARWRTGRRQLPVHLDHRMAGTNSAGSPERTGRNPVRLRHLPGRLPLEPAGVRKSGASIYHW